MYLIKANNISVRLGGSEILRSLSLALYPGELAGLLGPSGCGKTTLVRILLKMLEPSSGNVQYGMFSGQTDPLVIRKSFGYVPQDDIVHRSLTIEKAFLYSYLLRSGPKADTSAGPKKIESLMKTLDLQHRSNVKIRKLSGGQRKRVNLGIELLTDPVVLFLDEPTSGLDPHLDLQMMQLFKSLTSVDRSIMVTTHVLTNIELFDIVFFLYDGQLVFGGTPAAALAYFEVSEHELIYSKVRRTKAGQLAEKFRNSPFYQEFMQRGAKPVSTSPSASTNQKAPIVASGVGQDTDKPVAKDIESGGPAMDTIDRELQKLKERIQRSKEQ